MAMERSSVSVWFEPMADFYATSIDEELRLEEAELHDKEQELLVAINPPSSIEASVPLVEAYSSQVAPKVLEVLPVETPAVSLPIVSSSVVVASSPATSLPVIEFTSLASSGKSLTEIAPSKRPGRKLTRAPPSKRRLILPAKELPSEDFASATLSSTESTWDDLYPSPIFPSSSSSSNIAPGSTSFTFPLSVSESGSLPPSSSSYLDFAPPSIPTSSFSTTSSSIPVLPILLGEKQVVKTDKLKSDYKSTLADKLKALQLKDNEIASLNTSLNTAKTEASTKDAELRSS
ncbi:cell wall protein TIR4-like [Zingiber officinale]|uniref:cell wall protein TIR4-like n=1 Tax=Zingiber officinale TaxID=94328 RepID=UPI001C4D8CF6|nr:cell wall protein TIR4-like [Zingiber officinale]